MTPIDFQVTRSKVKVKVTKNIFTKWLSLQLRAHILYLPDYSTDTVYLNKKPVSSVLFSRWVTLPGGWTRYLPRCLAVIHLVSR
jgi:hypothetical protein